MGAVKSLRQIAKGEAHFDFVGRARTWFVISGVIILLSLGGLFIKHLNLGLAFKGGSSFSVPIAAGHNVPTVPEIKDALGVLGVADAQVQIAEGSAGKNVLVQARKGATSIAEQKQVSSKLAEMAGQTDPNTVSIEAVGAKWGRQISEKAVRGMIVFMILVVIYLSFRFEPKMAGASFVALFHDLIATAGIYALVGFEVTPATVVAILTILGYSLYDTVVVFDKVRENAAALGTSAKMSYGEMVNRSVNQVLMRSINTSLTSLLPAAGLLFVGAFLLGAETLKDLALALFIGIGVGTYSSIFIAAPVLALWKEQEPRYKQIKARLRSAGAGSRVAMAGGGTMTTTEASGDGEEPSLRAPIRVQQRSGGAKGRKGRGKKRRR
jgi:preprotein translocase subunit SecF